MVRPLGLGVVLAAVVSLLAPAVVEATPPGTVVYEHPVDADVVDPFRPPPTPFGAGNRGLKYGTEPGEPIRAAATGTVTFAGQVGGALHVTLVHADGRLTSYSGVGDIAVVRGERVERGELVARAVGVTHVGVREDGAYIDPALLFDGVVVTARLVPESPLHPTPFGPGLSRAELILIARDLRGDGGGGLIGSIGGAIIGAGGWVLGAGGDVLGWLRENGFELMLILGPVALEIAGANPFVAPVVFGILIPLARGEVPAIVYFSLDLQYLPFRAMAAFAAWRHHRETCTPADAPVEIPDEGRRVAVLIGGLDSTSTSSGVGALDTHALGYEAGDVVGFSYAGGRTPDRFGDATAELAPALAAIDANHYERQDSSRGLLERGELLADFLTEVAHSTPGATVDLYAHSQGGIVTRLALRELENRPGGGEVIEHLGLVTTLASPHEGADLALMAVELGSHLDTAVALELADSVTDGTLSPHRTNVADLARGSDLLEDLASSPLPEGPEYVSVAGTGDLTVTRGRTRLDGAQHVSVPIWGTSAHGELPGHEATTRQISLVMAGRGPTCRSAWEAMGDFGAIESVQTGTSALGSTVWVSQWGPRPWPDVNTAAAVVELVMDDD